MQHGMVLYTALAPTPSPPQQLIHPCCHPPSGLLQFLEQLTGGPCLSGAAFWAELLIVAAQHAARPQHSTSALPEVMLGAPATSTSTRLGRSLRVRVLLYCPLLDLLCCASLHSGPLHSSSHTVHSMLCMSIHAKAKHNYKFARVA